MTAPLSLYLHIPFCQYRCSYCDFNTYTTVGDLQAPYVAALQREIAAVAPGSGDRPVHTVFFGGGTPSLLTPTQLAAILDSLRAAFHLQPDAEITMEANPETVDAAYLGAARAAGVNRLSFGAQSAISSELALLGRQHGFDTVARAIAAAHSAGFDNLSLDLIYGVPDQTLASFDQTLSLSLALPLTHISLYCLTIEPGTPLDRWVRQKQVEPPDPDLAADQYELASERLAAAGLEQYEISNWARPGRACEHNLTYWRNREFLGLGAGAHGYAAGYRYHVVRQPRVYIRRLTDADAGAGQYPCSAAAAGYHQETAEEAMSTMIMMQLRLLREGLDLAEFQARFGRSLVDVYGAAVAQLQAWGLLKPAGDRLFLTEKGRFLSNQVFVRFM